MAEDDLGNISEAKDKYAKHLANEALLVWCNNPLEAVAMTQVGAMVRSYYNKFYGDHNFNVTPIPVKGADYKDFVFKYRLLHQGDFGNLFSRYLWNFRTLDSISYRIKERLFENTKLLEGSYKIIVSLSTHVYEIKLYYLETK